jgi:hypothetical protein
MTNHIFTDIEIHAPVSVVWEVLGAFDRYPDWNPFIRSIAGNKGSGAQLTVSLQPPGKGVTVIKPTIISYIPEREIRWVGHFITGGLFDGEHVLMLDPIDDEHVRFIHQEEFSGLLVQFFWNYLDIHVRSGFKAMNKSLKKVSEAGGIKYLAVHTRPPQSAATPDAVVGE